MIETHENRRQRTSRSWLLLAASATALTWSGGAAAQEDGVARVQPREGSQLSSAVASDDRITVTGTRIVGVSPVGSNVQIVDQEELQAFPAENIVETLKRQPAFSGNGLTSGLRNTSGPGVRGPNTTRGSDINLRGIGPKATLVLFDGNRTPPTGSTGRNLDSSLLPSAVLQRVEVLLDGSSALYGSEAIAGVVNFIPRHKFDGIEVRGRGATADAWHSIHASVLAGQDWDSGGFVVSYERRENSSLNGADRDYWMNDLTALGGNDYRFTECNPGNIVIDGVSYAIPEDGVTQATADQLVPGTENRCDLDKFVDIYGGQHTDTFFAGAEQEITDKLRVKVHGTYSRRKTTVLDTDIGSSHLFRSFTITDESPHFIMVPGTTATSYTVQHAFTEKLEDYAADVDLQFANADINVEYDLFGDWTATADFHWSWHKSRVFTLAPLPSEIPNALNVSDPDLAFNPFAGPGGNDQTVLGQIFLRAYDPSGDYNVYEATAGATGTLFSLPGGEVKLAMGGQFTRWDYYLTNHLGDIRTFEANLSEQNPIRNTWSGFGEIYIPIFGGPNARPGFESLEITAALRHDRYSDLDPGGTTNPKFGINWVPVEGLKIRGSYGTSFKAPFLNDAVSPAIGGALNYISLPDPLDPSGRSSGVYINNGNPNLSPESATTWTTGFDYTGIEGVTLNVTYFNIDYRGTIDAPDRDSILLDPLLAYLVTRDPSQMQINELPSIYEVDYRDGLPDASTVSWIIDGRPQNLGGVKLSGIDFVARYDAAMADWDVFAQVLGTYHLNYEEQLLDGGPYEDRLNDIYRPLRFKARADIGASRGPFSALASVNYINSYNNNLVTPNETIESTATFDLKFGVNFDEFAFVGDRGVLSGAQLAVEVINVFDKEPPYANIIHGNDSSHVSALGRAFALSLTKRF